MAAEHVIEQAPEDAPCATCGASIVEGMPRFVEVYSSDEGKQARSLRYARSRQRQVDADSDDRPSPFDGAVAADVAARFHHLDCAAKAMPYRLQPTLAQGAVDSIPPQVTRRLVMLGLLYPHRLVGDLDPVAWPALEHLSLDSARLDAVLVELVALPICEQLTRLELHGYVTAAGLEVLRGKLSLELLDLRDTEIDEPPTGLAARVELQPPPVAKKRPTGPWRVRHTKRPEWGEGRVVEETEQGIEVEFESAGRKLIKSPALLEDIE